MEALGVLGFGSLDSLQILARISATWSGFIAAPRTQTSPQPNS